jgi:hypothetical protein
VPFLKRHLLSEPYGGGHWQDLFGGQGRQSQR